MLLNNVKGIKVAAVAATLFYLGNYDLTVEASNALPLPDAKLEVRAPLWTMQALQLTEIDNSENVMKITTDDVSIFESNAAGVGNVMPSLDEVAPIENDQTLENTIEAFEDISVNLRASLTDAEFLLMYKIVAAEAKGESFEGKIAVAEVILNRVDSTSFPNNVTDVVYAPNQFEPVINGHLESAYSNLNTSLQEEIRSAVNEALKGSNYSQGALFFRTKQYHAGRTPLTQIGNHYFSK